MIQKIDQFRPYNETERFKNVNNWLSINISTYIETSGVCIIKLITAVINSVTYKVSVFVKASKKLPTMVKPLAYCFMELNMTAKSFMILTPSGQSSNLYLIVVHLSTLVLIRHLWWLNTVVFLHWCLICAVLFIAVNVQILSHFIVLLKLDIFVQQTG